MSDPRPVQLLDLFAALARRAGAAAAVPLHDGSLLYRFREGRRRVEVFHSPWHRPGGSVVRGVEGCFFVRGATDRFAAACLRRLAGARTRFPLSLDPLAVWEDADRPVVLDADFARVHLRRFLDAGRTAWGPFLFAGCDANEDRTVTLVFEGPAGRVDFRVAPSRAAREEGWRRFGPLAVRIAADGRDPAAAGSVARRVETYVYYAFHRAFRPGQPLAAARPEPAHASPNGDVPFRDDPDDRIRQNLDQVPEHAFFLDPFLRRIGTQETLGTLLAADEGLALVVHTDQECTTKLPWLKSCGHLRSLFARLHPLPTHASGREIEWLEPVQAQTIRGDDTVLLRALRRAAGRRKTRIVALMGTCVGDVTGLDYEGLAAAVEREFGKPVVVIGQMLEHFVEMDHTWELLLQIADRRRPPEADRINLVGYAPAESDLADELRGTIPRLGLRLNALLVPSFHSREARDFARAACTVLNPARSSTFEFARAAATFPTMRFHRIPPPFGKSATIAFYRGLAELAGAKDPQAEAEALWAPHEPEFAAWQERARGVRVCFLVRPGDATCLLEPEELHGLDLLRILAEFGFGIDLVVLAGPEGETARSRLERRAAADPLLAETVRTIRRPVREPTAILATLDARLCFSEFPPDRRALEAGKMFFQPRDIQPGLAGTVRSLARLVRLAESAFPGTWCRLRRAGVRHR